ncbi:MAG: hypothetical protein ACKOQ3_11310 [Novosphingobium sp.]
MNDEMLRETLPVEQRLALAYAPAAVRGNLLAVMALDTRLAKVFAAAREPIIGQLRLAWWRDRLGEGARPPRGEPLLDYIAARPLDRAVLGDLVDAWEGLLGDPASGPLDGLAGARARAILGAAGTKADAPAALAAAREWALADLARLPGDLGDLAAGMSAALPWRPARLPRTLRSLAVLHAMARSARRRGGNGGPGSILVVLRVGLLGI